MIAVAGAIPALLLNGRVLAAAWDAVFGEEPASQRLPSPGRRDQLTVVVVPGFLTESRDDRRGCLTSPRGGSQRDWHGAARGVAPAGARVRSFNWRAGRPVDLLGGGALPWWGAPFGGPLAGLGGGALAAWGEFRRAMAQADEAVADLAEVVARCAGPVALVGHSLGGRMVLRYAEAAGRGEVPQVRSIHSLAAAIAPGDLDWHDVARGARRRPVVVFSDADTLLQTVYRLGAVEIDEPVGLVGPPRGAPVTRRDLSAHGTGHLDYVDEMHRCVRGREVG